MGVGNLSAAAHYRDRGVEFFEAMKIFATDEKFGNTAALLAVHSAIAINDAVQMWYTGARGKTEDHRKAVNELRDLCGKMHKNTDGCKHFDWLLGRKSMIAYGEKRLRVDDDIKSAINRAERFQSWAFGNFRDAFQEEGA